MEGRCGLYLPGMKYLVLVFTVSIVGLSSCSRQVAKVAEGGLISGKTTAALQPDKLAGAKLSSPEPELATLTEAYIPETDVRVSHEAVSAWNSYFDQDTTIVEEDTTPEPVMQPLILAGAATTGAGIASTVLLFFGPWSLVLIPLLLIGGGVALTTFGYKKLKIEPEKYKGEKLARAVYYAMVGIGAVAMLIPVWLLFNL